MCRGIYNIAQCALYAEAVVGIGSPAPNNARTINFLVDTGATATIICAADATRLGLSYDTRGRPVYNHVVLPRVDDASGIGGKLKIYRLDNVFITLISHDNNGRERHTEFIESIFIPERRYQLESLLGMDLLIRFKLVVDSENFDVDLTRIPVIGTSYFVEHS